MANTILIKAIHFDDDGDLKAVDFSNGQQVKYENFKLLKEQPFDASTVGNLIDMTYLSLLKFKNSKGDIILLPHWRFCYFIEPSRLKTLLKP